MYPTKEYLDDILKVALAHPEAPSSSKIVDFVRECQAKEKTFEELHKGIEELLLAGKKIDPERPEPAGWQLLKEIMNRKQKNLAKNLFITKLAEVMKEPRLMAKPPVQLSTPPCTPDGFTRAFYQMQLASKSNPNPDKQVKINNAVQDLKKKHKQHYDHLLNQKLTHYEQIYHKRRLATLERWTKDDNFEDLINIISKMKDTLNHSDISISLTETELETSGQYNQNLLNWLGMVFENFHAQESPFAMSEILEILSMWKATGDTRSKQALYERLHEFACIYIFNDSSNPCVIEINICQKANKDYVQSLNTLKESIDKDDPALFSLSLAQMRKSLVDIYNELARLVINASQAAEELRQLENTVNMGHPGNRAYTGLARSFSASSLDAVADDAHKPAGLFYLKSSKSENDSLNRMLNSIDSKPVESSGSSKSESTQSQLPSKHKQPIQNKH